MNRVLQLTLLGLHGVMRRSGVLATRPGRRLFEIGYDLYKAGFEAGEIAGLRRYVVDGASVVDIGANIGFFTVRFARWVSDGGRVLALEPESDNYRRLQDRLRRGGLAGRVDAVHAAAAEQEGRALLNVNPDHPGDHCLGGEDGRDGNRLTSVPTVTLDGELAARGWPTVSLVKIDVQGAEPRVIAGARETLQRFAPAIWMEVDPGAMRRAGADPVALLELMAAAGYRPHCLFRSGAGPALTVTAAAALAESRGYADFLFLPVAGNPAFGF